MADNVAILLVKETKMQEFLNINALPCHLRTIWIAAYFLKKLGRQEVATVDLSLSSQQIIMLMKKQNLNLRISGGLLVGIINLYIKQLSFFVQDCSALLNRLMKNTPEDALVAKRSCNVTKRVLRHGGKKTLKIKRRKPNSAQELFNAGFLPKRLNWDSATHHSRLDNNGLPKESDSTLCNAMKQNKIALNTSTSKRYSNLETLSLECYPKGVLSFGHPSHTEMEPLVSGQSTNWAKQITSESKWLEEVDDTLQSEGQDFALGDLGVISGGGHVAIGKMGAWKSHKSAPMTYPSEIKNFHEIEALRAAESPDSTISVTRNLLLNDPHTSVTCLTAQRQRFSISDLNSGHTTVDDNTPLRFSMETSEPVFHTPYANAFSSRNSTVLPAAPTSYSNSPFNPSDNNLGDLSLNILEKQNAISDDAEDHWTIMLSDLDEPEQINPQANPSLHSFVRRHQMGSSSKKLDSCVQLDPKVLKEWQTFSLPLLRPFHTNYQRDVDSTLLYRYNVFPLFVPKYFINDDINPLTKHRMSCALDGYDPGWNQATRTPIKEKVLSEKVHFNHYDTPTQSANDLMVSPWSPKDVSVKSFEFVHESGSFKNGTPISAVHKTLNNDDMMTDLFKALYDKDNLFANTTETYKLNDFSKTPLKTPLKRYIEFHNVASPKSNVSFESGDAATTVNGETMSACESSSAGSFSLHALSPKPMFLQTPIGEHHQDTKQAFNDKNTSLALLQVFETPIHAPGNKLYNKKNMATSWHPTSKAFSTTLFHYASGSESIKMSLCREVGFCKRTIRLLEHISYRLVQTKNEFSSPETQPCITFDKLVESQSQTTVAATFFELLTLTTRMFIDIKQENTTKNNQLLITFGERYNELITETSL